MTDPQPSCSGKPWEDKDGATDTDGFLKAFAENDNTFWLMESGHAKNIIEELIERLEAKQKTIEGLQKELLGLRTYCTFTFGESHPEMRKYVHEAAIESLRAEVERLKDLMSSLIEDIEDGTFDKNDNRQQYVLLLKDKVK